MTLYVYNPARERIGLVEDVRSLQWLSEYQDAGEIKLVCSATEKNRALLVDGNACIVRSSLKAPSSVKRK